MASSGSISKTAVWVLLALLILGLAGFGATNLSGNLRSVGSVGDKQIEVGRYVRDLQQEMRAVEAQTGQPLTFAQAREIGLDRAVLQRLVAQRAIDNEATELGLSVGDGNVRDQVLKIPAFQGINGGFDRDSYRFALENAGLSEADFETQLREETSRNLLQSAVLNGVKMPDSYADALIAYVGERRDFTFARLGADALDAPLPTATEDELRAYHSDNQEDFTLPATRKITYAWLTPDMLVDQVELEESALRDAYAERASEYNQPERRLVERLVFPDQEAADQAAAALEVNGTNFEALVDERGLALADVDLGDVDRLELDAAGEAVFSAEVGDVVGPLPSSLGPALFRVNGILPAQSVSYEDALPELREGLALDRARRLIDAQADSLDDLLAGGATLEELAQDSDMALGQIDWTEESGEDIAAYADFREAAAKLSDSDYPAIASLDDGGLYAMRLDDSLPERPAPFDVARDAVAAALNSTRLHAALEAKAATLLPQLTEGTSFADLGLTVTEESDRTRGGFLPNVPASFLEGVFDMDPDTFKSIPGDDQVLIVRLNAVKPPEDNAQVTQMRQGLQAQVSQGLANDLLDIYATEVTLRAGPQVDQRAVDAVLATLQ